MSCGLICMNSCAQPEVEVEKKMQVFPDKLVARVSSINAAEGYALIQRYGRLKVADDVILYSLGVDGEVANLKVTGERLGQFIAADITSGMPNIGDAIYLRNLDESSEDDNKDAQIINKSN